MFRVSGNVELESPLTVRHPYLPIAGQTAPGAGICLKNYPMNIDTQRDVGGWPALPSGPVPADTDRDGMPDAWEDRCGLDKDNPADRNTVAPDGCTMLEKYLHGIR